MQDLTTQTDGRQDLRIAVVQSALVWQDWAANKAQFTARIESLAGQADVIVLPEMFTTGFSMDTATSAQSMDGDAVNWMRAMAESSGAAICGSMVMEEPGVGFTNRFLWMPPAGAYSYYDKRHLFRMGAEHQHYQSGDRRVVIDYRGWRILPLVCYDLRFPVWSRNRQDYDLMVLVANWPAKRSMHWKVLSQARAIENQAYVAVCNRVGEDGNGWSFSGDSRIISAEGEILAELEPDADGVLLHTLSSDKLTQYREGFPAWQDADSFTLS